MGSDKYLESVNIFETGASNTLMDPGGRVFFFFMGDYKDRGTWCLCFHVFKSDLLIECAAIYGLLNLPVLQKKIQIFIFAIKVTVEAKAKIRLEGPNRKIVLCPLIATYYQLNHLYKQSFSSVSISVPISPKN